MQTILIIHNAACPTGYAAYTPGEHFPEELDTGGCIAGASE
jgi:hypothetical protein